MRALCLAGALSLATIVTGTASAIPPPATAAHVDPGAPCFRWPAVDMDGDGVFDRIDHCVSTPAGCAVDRYGCTLDGDGDGVCDGLDRCPSTPAGMKVDQHGCHAGAESLRDTRSQAEPPREVAKEQPRTPAPSGPVSESERQLIESGRIRLENVYFETASARLLPESEASLNEAGEALEKFPDLRIEVEGHTDTRGSSKYNMSLSQARAEAVRDFLLARFKLRSEHLSAKGYG